MELLGGYNEVDSYYEALKRGLVGDPRIAYGHDQLELETSSLGTLQTKLKTSKRELTLSLKQPFVNHVPALLD